MSLNALEWQFKNTLKREGKDIKINNQDARVLMKNLNNEYDDKEIITEFNFRQGMYVNYSNKWWIIISDAVDYRFASYKKATIRKCEHSINFIINEKLYAFPALFETADMAIREGQLWIARGDTIKIRIPRTEISNKIETKNRIIKFGFAHEVWGINERKENILEITLWSGLIDINLDDKENEIANRYKSDGIDVLKGNIRPIMPFDEITNVYNAIVEFYAIDVETNNNIDDAIVMFTNSSGNTTQLLTGEPYEFAKGLYTYTVEKEGYALVEGTIDLQDDTIKFVFMEVAEEPPIDEGLAITGETRVGVWDTPVTYTVNTDEPVLWTIMSGTTAKIASQSGNICSITHVSQEKFGKNTLRVELVEDSTQFAEIEINIVFM